MRGKQIILYTDTNNDKQVFDSLLYACEYLAIPYRSAIRHISKGEKHKFNGKQGLLNPK